MTESFPLKWPIGRSRTPPFSRKDARFETTMGKARDEMLHELRLLGAKNIVISTNVATYKRGSQTVPYANQAAAKEDPGVAVYYIWNGEQYALACDRWKTLTDNIQALNKTVSAIRGIDRWGTGEMMKAAFSGFKALPAATAGNRAWHEVMNLPQSADWLWINIRYMHLAKQRHPDAGGSHEAFVELQQAYQDAKTEKGIDR